jgi:hypothetical protein
MQGAIMTGRKFRKTKLVLIREPNGRAQRSGDEKEFPPAAVKRLRDAAMSGMADPEWGSAAGRLFLAGKISTVQYAAAKRWAERVEKYHHAINAPPPNPRALVIGGASHGNPPDPDSEEGRKRAAKETQAVTDFKAAHGVLCAAGMISEAVVRNVCERDAYPAGQLELEAAQRGLLWLAQFWGLTNHGKSNVK